VLIVGFGSTGRTPLRWTYTRLQLPGITLIAGRYLMPSDSLFTYLAHGPRHLNA